MERKHIADRNRPRASNILSYRIVESLRFMIFGKSIDFQLIFHGFPMEAGGRQKMWADAGCVARDLESPHPPTFFVGHRPPWKIHAKSIENL